METKKAQRVRERKKKEQKELNKRTVGKKAKRVDEDTSGDERTSSKPRAEGNLTDSEDEID